MSNIATMTPTTKPQTSKEVIAANVQLLIEQLEAGHSEGLTAYLTAMGRFHNYSFSNILEIARQKPDATRVAGLYAWNQLGRKAPLYDVGDLSDRGMLPCLDGIPRDAVIGRLSLLKYRNARGSHIYIRPSGEHRYTVLDDLSEISLAKLMADGFTPCAVVETSAGNFQAWLKHPAVLPKLLGSLAAQTLAARYDADPSAAGWRRFGRLPGFTNCKPKYRRPDGLFPFVRLKSCSGEQYPMADAFAQEIAELNEEREQQREARRLQASLSPRRGPRLSTLSLERFRTSSKYHDRPAAADIAFCVAAYVNGMDQARIERALEDDYLSRDPSPSKRASYIRRTMTKARDWALR
ncbi:hypothetical protein HDF16_005305 [Granulicella aggregans]|uniref:RepB-like DNA primase domain-containing protein n=1 Tax=Granulicella aggregans TaxID=474949 RepID=A0A7W7ZJ93_9BACT|nr:RepB family DNA primase [Granulicella aggregans]MBB5060569.1 hypothetical protein [Granulicella aggregans]